MTPIADKLCVLPGFQQVIGITTILLNVIKLIIDIVKATIFAVRFSVDADLYVRLLEKKIDIKKTELEKKLSLEELNKNKEVIKNNEAKEKNVLEPYMAIFSDLPEDSEDLDLKDLKNITEKEKNNWINHYILLKDEDEVLPRDGNGGLDMEYIKLNMKYNYQEHKEKAEKNLTPKIKDVNSKISLKNFIKTNFIINMIKHIASIIIGLIRLTPVVGTIYSAAVWYHCSSAPKLPPKLPPKSNEEEIII